MKIKTGMPQIDKEIDHDDVVDLLTIFSVRC
jgi:hypothetical protein